MQTLFIMFSPFTNSLYGFGLPSRILTWTGLSGYWHLFVLVTLYVYIYFYFWLSVLDYADHTVSFSYQSTFCLYRMCIVNIVGVTN